MQLLLGLVLTLGVVSEVHSASQNDVFAAVGSGAFLPCPWLEADSTQSNGYKRLSVLWRRKTQKSSDFSTVLSVENSGLVKKGLVVIGRTWVTESYFRKGNYSLWIQPVQMDDAGIYICKVEYGTDSISREVRLHTMAVRPNHLDSLTEEDSVTLTCDITGDLPRGTTLQWYHDGTPIFGSRYQLSHTKKELSIKGLRSTDAGRWTCQLRQESTVTEAAFALDVLGFLDPVSESVTVYAGVGSTVDLPCRVHEGAASATSGWTRQGFSAGSEEEPFQNKANQNDVPSSHPRISFKHEGRGNLTLTISPVLESDSGTYTCFLQVLGKRIQRIIKLVVAKVSADGSGMVKEGSSLTLTCDADGVTAADRFEWTREESATATATSPTWRAADMQNKTPYQGRMLTLKRVSNSDAGTWWCWLYEGERRMGHIEYHLEMAGSLHGEEVSNPTGKVTTAIIFSLIVLLLVVLVLLMVQRRRRQRARGFPALENARNSESSPEASKKGWSSKKDQEDPSEKC